MSLHIPIQKDIGEYEEKIIGRMSARTLLCVSCGFAAAIAVGAACFLVLRVDPSSATFPVMCACLPFWLAGFWRPYGMKLEEFLPHLISFHANDQTLLASACLEVAPVGPKAGKRNRRYLRTVNRKGAELYGQTSTDRH